MTPGCVGVTYGDNRYVIWLSSIVITEDRLGTAPCPWLKFDAGLQSNQRTSTSLEIDPQSLVRRVYLLLNGMQMKYFNYFNGKCIPCMKRPLVQDKSIIASLVKLFLLVQIEDQKIIS